MILKFQSGGIPFVEYTPLNLNTASNYSQNDLYAEKRKALSGDKDSEKLTEKDLLMAIKDIDALPSDSAALYDRLVQVVRMQEMYGDFDPTLIATQFIRALLEIKTAVYRKEAFKEAYENVKDNKGLNEYAVTSDGRIAVLDSDKGIDFVTLLQLYSGEYLPLTNSDLLKLRAESFANLDGLTQVISNGIGMEKITSLINNAMHTLGSNENKIEGYTKTPEQLAVSLLSEKVRQLATNPNLTDALKNDLATGLLAISVSGVKEPGFYLFTNIDKNSEFQIKAALSYIYDMLPQNAKTILELRSNGKGGRYTIMQLLLSTANDTHSLSWDMIENENGVKPGTKESADSLKLDPVKGFILGRGFLKLTEINIGTSKSFVVNGRYSTLVDKSGNPLMPNSTLLDVMGSAFQGELDFNSVTMGGELISGDRSKVLINDATIIRVDLPIDVKSALKGIIKPDLAMLRRVEDAEADIKVRNITDEEQINKIYEDNELPPKFIKKNGKWEGNNAEWTSFAVIGAAAEETAFEDPDLLTLLTPITNKGKKEEMAAIFKKQDKDYSYSDNFFSKTGFYKGQIFIPLRDNLVSASYSSGNYFNLKDSEEADRKQFLQKAYVKPQEE